MKIVVVIIVNPVEPCNMGMDGTVSNWKFTHLFLKQSTIAKMYEKWQHIIVSLRIVTIVIHNKQANKQPFSFPFC